MYKELDIEAFAKGNDKFRIARATIVQLEDILGEEAIFEYTDDNFRNPDTGYHLFIDAYFPISNIAFEYNGQQHYKNDNFFYRNEKDFEKSKKLDKIKKEKIKESGMLFLEISYKEPVTNVDLIKKNSSNSIT